jgi:hypothetical protein
MQEERVFTCASMCDVKLAMGNAELGAFGANNAWVNK